MQKEANRLIDLIKSNNINKFGEIKVKAWDLDQSAGLLFIDGDQATDFHTLYKELYKDEDHMWSGKKMRIMKDSTFEERMRRQMYYNMKAGIQKILVDKKKWDDTNIINDTGTRGAIFIYDKDELTSIFKINFDKIGIE
eukprot:3889191-Heterocapsa_arctica.AAC.1